MRLAISIIALLFLVACTVSAEVLPEHTEVSDSPESLLLDAAAILGEADSLPPMSPANALIAAKYDLNRNGTIERDEVIAAINDYMDGLITRDDVLIVITFYFSQEPVGSPQGAPEQISDMVERVRTSVVKVSKGGGSASGVIVKVEEGNAYIVTNQHVVDFDTTVMITVGDTMSLSGEVVGADKDKDVAVIKVSCSDCTPVGFGDSSKLRVGDRVVAIGYARDDVQPTALEPPPRFTPGVATVTSGIISAFRKDTQYGRDLVQTDAALNPGNSGGPLFNLDGEVIGINTFIIGFVRQNSGLSYAVLETTVQEMLPLLMSGTYPRPVASRTVIERRVFGPIYGHIHQDNRTRHIDFFDPHQMLEDGDVRVIFRNPASGGNFSYGFRLYYWRDGRSLYGYVWRIGNAKYWRIMDRHPTLGDRVIATGPATNLHTGAGNRNAIRMVIRGMLVDLYLNDKRMSRPLTVISPRANPMGAVYLASGIRIGTGKPGDTIRFGGFQAREYVDVLVGDRPDDTRSGIEIHPLPGVPQLIDSIPADTDGQPAQPSGG